ncbi:MAG: ABC transporter ATP-binding protein [Firmicutes bacterium]|nr:ABC transporter ATP-binding protein [Bacillota bacterium]
MRGHRLGIPVLTVVDIIIALLAVYEAIALRNLINNATAGEEHAFVLSSVFLAGLILARIALHILTRWLNERTKADLENVFKGRLFGMLLTKDYASVAAVHSGEWMNRLTSDTVQVASNAAEIVPNVLATLVKLVASVLLVMYLIKDVAWVIFPCAAVMIIVVVILRRKMKVLHKKIQESDGRLRVFLSDILSSLMIVRSFSREDASMEKAEERMEDHKARRMERIRFSNIATTGYNIILDAVYVIAVVYCGHGILTGNINYGTFAAVISLVGKIQGPISSISSYIPRWYAMQASAERLMEAETFADDCSKKKRSREEVLYAYSSGFKSIQLRDISFTYRTQNEEERSVVIDGADLTVGKQEIVAITGPSGCGKSTLLKILMCFYPLDSGSRKLVFAEGEEELDASWRGLFAYVPQGNQLMSGTIKDVLTFGDSNVPEEEINAALDIACASGFISELPQGLSTVLGERGSGLSEGQIQRLAIARAILSKQPVLLLDEATSSLDEATEAELIEKLRTLTDRTVIIVTHRLKVLSICNRELHMDENGITVRSRDE